MLSIIIFSNKLPSIFFNHLFSYWHVSKSIYRFYSLKAKKTV